MLFRSELNIYIDVMKRSPEFITCDSLSGLALKLVQKRQHLTFPLVYRLITLALTLPVANDGSEVFWLPSCGYLFFFDHGVVVISAFKKI